MGELTASAPAGSADRALAALALRPDWTLAAGMVMVERDGISVAPLIASFSGALEPLKDRPGDDLAFGQLDNALRPIGAKIAAMASPEQASAWRAALVAALSDLPPSVVVRAAGEALHVPMQFLNEVERVVREKAAVIEARQRQAMGRLMRLQREIEEAAKPKLVAPAGYEGGKLPPMTIEEVRKMARGPAGKSLMAVGVGNGAISQEDHDLVMGEIEAEMSNG